MALPEGERVWLCLGFAQNQMMICPGWTLQGGSTCPPVAAWRPRWSVKSSRDTLHVGHRQMAVTASRFFSIKCQQGNPSVHFVGTGHFLVRHVRKMEIRSETQSQLGKSSNVKRKLATRVIFCSPTPTCAHLIFALLFMTLLLFGIPFSPVSGQMALSV